MMYVSFYTYRGDKRTVSKDLGSAVATLPCFVQGQCSVLTPNILAQYNAAVIGCNYMYIDTFGRYYKITDLVVDEAKQMHITGAVDPLKTWDSQIRSCPGSVSRSEQTGVGDIIDSQLPIVPGAESTLTEDIMGTLATTGLSDTMAFVVTLK